MRKFTASLLALVCLALCVPDASAGCRLFQRFRDRRQQRQEFAPQQAAPQIQAAVPLTYVPGEAMPSPAQFGISPPALQAPSCSGGSCSAPRGLFRR